MRPEEGRHGLSSPLLSIRRNYGLVRPLKISADWASTALVALVAGPSGADGVGLRAAMIPAELAEMLFTVPGPNDGRLAAMIPAELAVMLSTDAGLRAAMIPAELAEMLFTVPGPNDGRLAAMIPAELAVMLSTDAGLRAAMIPAELAEMLFTVAGPNDGRLAAMIPAELAVMLFTAAGPYDGRVAAMIPNEFEIMLFTAPDEDNPRSWSFLEPLRPALSLPLMVVATRAATAQHAARILRGVIIEKVVVERSGDAKTIGSDRIESNKYDSKRFWHRTPKTFLCLHDLHVLL
jgi:hypothetical protein